MHRGSGTPHKKRERVQSHTPLMITMKLCKGLPSLRTMPTHDLWKEVLRALRRARSDFRVVHYVLMGNHIHMLVEVDSTKSLSSGMISLKTRFARRWNKMLGRKGKVFGDHYHHWLITAPHEARNAIAYVLKNARKHGIRWFKGIFDPYSSASLFPGWVLPKDALDLLEDVALQDVVFEPRTDLLAKDWLMAGSKISARTAPGRGY